MRRFIPEADVKAKDAKRMFYLHSHPADRADLAIRQYTDGGELDPTPFLVRRTAQEPAAAKDDGEGEQKYMGKVPLARRFERMNLYASKMLDDEKRIAGQERTGAASRWAFSISSSAASASMTSRRR